MRNDRRGIEGLPLRLMLVALLISLSLPTMLSFMHGASSNLAGDRAAEIAERLAITVQDMAAGGPGNVRIVNLPNDLPNGIVISIGGENGTLDCTRISWKAGGEGGTRYLQGVLVLTEDGCALKLSAGDAVRLECPPDQYGTVRAVRT